MKYPLVLSKKLAFLSVLLAASFIAPAEASRRTGGPPVIVDDQPLVTVN